MTDTDESTQRTYATPDAPGLSITVTRHTTGQYSAAIYVDGQLARQSGQMHPRGDHTFTTPYADRAYVALSHFQAGTEPEAQPVPGEYQQMWNTWHTRVGDRPTRLLDHIRRENEQP